MRRVCAICRIVYGFKEPLDDDSETTGYCPDCFDQELKKLEQYRETGIDPWKRVDPTS